MAVAVCVLLTIDCASAADLSIAVGADVTSIDPHYHNLTPNNNIAEHIFETLVTKDPKSQLKPALAVSWKALDDLTWEFTLRKGVKFHDGSDFTAADVIFSLERPALVPNSPSPFTLYTNQITEKIIVDPLTVRLKTATPYPLMPNDMGTVFIVSVESRERRQHCRLRFRQGNDRHRAVPVRSLHQRRSHRAHAQRHLLGCQTGVGQSDVPCDPQ
jgi:peptide/nickel transport system substrate-binding protein